MFKQSLSHYDSLFRGINVSLKSLLLESLPPPEEEADEVENTVERMLFILEMEDSLTISS